MDKAIIIFLLLAFRNFTTVHILFDAPQTSKVSKIEIRSWSRLPITADQLDENEKKYSNLENICPRNWTLLEVEFFRDVPITGYCENRNEDTE